jgi:hypothetical protein
MLGATTLNERSGDGDNISYGYRESIVASQKVNWKIEDIIGGDKKLDFTKRFMPESLARVEKLSFLNDDEKRILNHIRANTYLAVFVIVEEFIVPFVLDHLRPSLAVDDDRSRAFLQFAGEEVKHIQLFKTFGKEFRDGFPTECKIIGPADEIGKAILSNNPLSVGLAILMIEWMTQGHYIDSVKDDTDIDVQFKSLLRNHWLEEAQHAKLDTRMVESIAEGLSPEAINEAVDGFFEIGGFLDNGFKTQTEFDLESFELATGRTLNEAERKEFIEVQTQANRWTYIGSGMVHPKFLQTMERLGADQKKRIIEAAPIFC